MLNALVVGAGPAGLATSRELTRRGIAHAVVERGETVGHTWANLYDGLVLHTGRHLSALPGMPFPPGTPLFPTRCDFIAYLHRYAARFEVPLTPATEVTSAFREGDGWTLRTTAGTTIRTRAVVMATGILSNPHVPVIPGRDRYSGRVMHSVEYRRPDPFAGSRVLVVGAGNSAGELAAELAGSGADVTLAVRSGARVVPRELFGIPIQYFAVALAPFPQPVQRLVQRLTSRVSELARGRSPLPRPRERRCSDVPLIGWSLLDGIRRGAIALKPGLARFTGSGAAFTDGTAGRFDIVVLATGYRAALGPVRDCIAIDACGFASRRRRVISTDQPDLYFVGHTYDTRGALLNIGRDARRAAAEIARRARAGRGAPL